MSSEEGNLFAGVLGRKKTTVAKPAASTSNADDLFAPAATESKQRTNLFKKVRNPTTASATKSSKDENEEEKKADGASRFLDNLFAPAPAERKTTYGSSKRNLSEDFLGKLNSTNLVDKVKRKNNHQNDEEGGDEEGNKKGERRKSVASNIAIFQNVIN